jgi:hypothetical protein
MFRVLGFIALSNLFFPPSFMSQFVHVDVF